MGGSPVSPLLLPRFFLLISPPSIHWTFFAWKGIPAQAGLQFTARSIVPLDLTGVKDTSPAVDGHEEARENN